MDDSLAQAAIDLSGRAAFVFNARFTSATIGTFPVELVEEFFKSLAAAAKMNLHLNCPYGMNNHHISEASQSHGQSSAQVVSPDPRNPEIPVQVAQRLNKRRRGVVSQKEFSTAKTQKAQRKTNAEFPIIPRH